MPLLQLLIVPVSEARDASGVRVDDGLEDILPVLPAPAAAAAPTRGQGSPNLIKTPCCVSDARRPHSPLHWLNFKPDLNV